MSEVPEEEKFQGCLVGQALGDALGFAVEGRPPEVCREYAREVLGQDRDDRGGERFTGGQYSDDTQLARELMQSYAARGGFYPEDYARRIRDIFAEGRIVGYGSSTAAAARRLARGTPWREARTPPPAASNGSAMRAGPIGLLFHNDPKGLVQAATEQGMITHADPRCSAGAVIVAGAVTAALRGGAVEPAPFLEGLTGLCEGVEPGFAAGLTKLAEWLLLPPEEAAGRISAEGFGTEEMRYRRWRGISPFVVGSVLWSLYAFLRSPDDYRQTIRTAIAVGGDVDTTAAMAGAMSGARLGLGAVPEKLARRLTDRGTWEFEELVDLAGRCHRITRSESRGY
jgi:ADP-ribosylglycohydrolase